MNDWRELTLRILIDRSVDEVYDHWARPALLGRWFVEAAHQTPEGKPQPADEAVFEGCRYRWTWADGSSGDGEFTQVEPPHQLAFTFGDEVGVVVRFGQFEDGRTLVELRQTHGQAEESVRTSWYCDCIQGWTLYLSNLRSVLEGGIDLREKTTFLPNMANL